MQRRPLGRTGLMVSPLGFGGAELGFGQAEDSRFAQVLNEALDAGLNVIDTAECYGRGEEGIGNTVSQRRGDFVLFSKCGHASGLEHKDWSIELLEATLDRSLKRLKTDFIDVYQLHSCSEEILRQGDVIDFLQNARTSGKIRYIGYSGDHAAAPRGMALAVSISNLHVVRRDARAYSVYGLHSCRIGWRSEWR